jgi:branched-chain amino acid transport system substrate-binding protein
MGWWTTRPGGVHRPGARAMFGVAAAALAVAGCSGGDDQATTTTSTIAVTTTTISPRAADGTLSIGAFLPRTGPGAAFGGPMMTAVQQAVDQINVAGGVLGQRVEFTPADESARTGLDELLAAGVDAIVGPASSTVALSQLAEAVNPATGVVTCSPTASALALDDYPDNKLFFRTIPSDSFQMEAIEVEVEGTGVESVAIGYLDDPYGRALKNVLVDRIRAANEVTLQTNVGFEADQEELDGIAKQLLAGKPGVVVVLGDADDGTRLLQALDTATSSVDTPPLIVVNDAIRDGRQAIAALSPEFRNNIRGVGPLATTRVVPGPEGFFTANAVDCVNLIALAAIQAGSDDPAEIKKNMASVSAGGQVCTGFADCAERLAQGLSIDYSGYSGDVELSATTGDRTKAWFEAFKFNDDGEDQSFEAPFELTVDR